MSLKILQVPLFQFGNSILKNVSQKCVYPFMRSSWIHADAKEQNISKSEKRKMLKELRETTGYPLLKCKQALEKCNYSMEEAVSFINTEAVKEGWSKMEFLKNRPATQGLITIIGDKEYKRATMIEINCETDFVARTEHFHSLMNEAARSVHWNITNSVDKICDIDPQEVFELKSVGKGEPIKNIISQTVSKLKENIVISRVRSLVVDKDSEKYIGLYIHPSNAGPQKGQELPVMGRYAAVTMVNFLEDSEHKFLKLRDITQHIVGMNPKCIGTPLEKKDDIEASGNSEDEVTNNKHEEQKNDDDDDDSEAGFISTPVSNELLKQPFLLNTEMTVNDWLNLKGLEILDFERYEVGKGLEK